MGFVSVIIARVYREIFQTGLNILKEKTNIIIYYNYYEDSIMFCRTIKICK